MAILIDRDLDHRYMDTLHLTHTHGVRTCVCVWLYIYITCTHKYVSLHAHIIFSYRVARTHRMPYIAGLFLPKTHQ